jgi:hypothetical protein
MALYPPGLQGTLYPLGLNPRAVAVLFELRYCLLEFATIAPPGFGLELLAVPLMAWVLADTPETGVDLAKVPVMAIAAADLEVAFALERICEHTVAPPVTAPTDPAGDGFNPAIFIGII